MTKEDIKKAATEYANEACRPLWRTGYEQVCMVDFMEGAKWRISNAWHDVKEMPENNRMILIIMKHDIPTVLGPDNTFFREEIKDRHIQRWAYVEDLIPNTEG